MYVEGVSLLMAVYHQLRGYTGNWLQTLFAYTPIVLQHYSLPSLPPHKKNTSLHSPLTLLPSFIHPTNLPFSTVCECNTGGSTLHGGPPLLQCLRLLPNIISAPPLFLCMSPPMFISTSSFTPLRLYIVKLTGNVCSTYRLFWGYSRIVFFSLDPIDTFSGVLNCFIGSANIGTPF